MGSLQITVLLELPWRCSDATNRAGSWQRHCFSGALHKGTADLDLETEHVTRELSLVIQALIILSVSAEGLWSWMSHRRKPQDYNSESANGGEEIVIAGGKEGC